MIGQTTYPLPLAPALLSLSPNATLGPETPLSSRADCPHEALHVQESFKIFTQMPSSAHDPLNSAFC